MNKICFDKVKTELKSIVMNSNWPQLSSKDLEDKYNRSQNDLEIAHLEQELALRHGFQSSDQWFEHISGLPSQDIQTYALNDDQSDNGPKGPPFYSAQVVENIEGSDALCELCSHLDFEYIITHLVPERELSLGYIQDITRKPDCPFCRMVIVSIRSALGRSESPLEDVEKTLEVGLKTVSKNEDLTLFDIEIELHPSPIGGHPRIRIQRLAEEGSKTDFHGRLVGSRIDFGLVKQWLTTCESAIRMQLSSAKEKDDVQFIPTYLIDVNDNCIVSLDETNPYLALSYVWGGQQPLQLILENKHRLSKTNGLLCEASQVPATIAHAMELVRQLGYQYLWVDALCIVQDDRASKEPELRSMDEVYTNAVLTIIAGYGSNVHAGLPGVAFDRQPGTQHVERIRGMLFVNRLLTISDSIENSVWNSRAWTYQERILARRKLFISAQQVMFKCEHTETELCEDVHSLPFRASHRAWRPDEARNRKWTTTPESLDELLPPSGAVNTAVYSSIVQRFTSRKISFANDILNAFIGVSNRLAPGFRDGFRFGLPKNELDTQLLWQPLGPIRRRIDAGTGREIYPSWSWAGWEGPVTGNVGGRKSVPHVEFKRDDDSGWFGMEECRGVEMERVDEGWEEVEWRGHVFWREREGKDEFFAHPVAVSRGFRAACRPKLALNEHGSAEILCMRAEVARFVIGEKANPHAGLYLSPSQGVKALSIYATDDTWIGTVFVPEPVADRMVSGMYDCVKISSTATDDRFWGYEPSMLMPFEACYDREECPPTVQGRDQIDILVMEMRNNVFHRLGAGVCHIRAFESASPRRQEILFG